MALIEVRLDAPILRRWHLELLDALAGVQDKDVRLVWTPSGSRVLSRRLERVMRLERVLHGIERGALAPISSREVARYVRHRANQRADLAIDLTESPLDRSDVWTVLYDGQPGPEALVASLRHGRPPLVSVVDADGRTVAAGRPGSESPELLSAAMADVTAGVRALIVGSVAGRHFAAPVVGDLPPGEALSYSAIVARRVVAAARHRVYRGLYRAPHWRVGWRFGGEHPIPLDREGGAPWHDLADDGFHFYADPFPFEHQGRTFLFVEDFDHRVGKGVISVVEFDDAGPLGAPRPVLTHEVHLSYPFVLEHDGEVWMVPETSEAGRIELYRATGFPDEWKREEVLVDGVAASDATPFFHDGTWWMMATVRDGGSFSDALHIWSAPDLRGPWTPHRHNPVLIDIASARPGGRVVEVDGRLLRPTQDGRAGYGAAMTIAEITRLDDDGYEQDVIRHLGPSHQWSGRRLHTTNLAGRLETVDGSRLAPRYWSTKRSDVPRGSRYNVQREDDFEFTCADYAALLDRSDATAFQDGTWLDLLYEQLAPARGARKVVVTVRRSDDGQLAMVLPLVRRRQGPVRLVEFADLGVADYAAPVVDREAVGDLCADDTVGERVVAALGPFDLLRIERVADSPEPLRSLISGAKAKQHLYDTHTISLPATEEQWRQDGITASFRRYLKRKSKKLATYGDVQFRTVTDPREIDPLMRTLQTYREERFRDRRASDLMQDPASFDFYSAVARAGASGSGPSVVRVLEVDGEPLAIALDLRDGDADLHLLPGYDTRLRGTSVGLTLVERLVTAAIAEGRTTYDLTVGDEPYKADFGAARRPLYEVHLAATAAGRASVTARTGYLRGRRMAKRALVAWEDRRKAKEKAAQEAADRERT